MKTTKHPDNILFFNLMRQKNCERRLCKVLSFSVFHILRFTYRSYSRSLKAAFAHIFQKFQQRKGIVGFDVKVETMLQKTGAGSVGGASAGIIGSEYISTCEKKLKPIIRAHF